MYSPNLTSANSSPEEIEAYAKAKAKYYEDNIAMIDKILVCFDKKSNKADIHACIEGLTLKGKVAETSLHYDEDIHGTRLLEQHPTQ